MKNIELIVGEESDLLDLLKKFGTHDKATIQYCWKNAKRRNHLLILSHGAMGDCIVSIIPPDKFDIHTRKIKNQYKQFWLGWNIKSKAMYVFSSKEVIDLMINMASAKPVKDEEPKDEPRKPNTSTKKRRSTTTTKAKIRRPNGRRKATSSRGKSSSATQ